MDTTFQSKYEEFCNDLLAACPELTKEIEAARAIPKEQRAGEYKTKVLKETLKSETHLVLPGVTISTTIWESLSKNSQKAIKEYNSILNLCVIYESGDVDGIPQEWVDTMMREWRTRMEGMDFNKMSSKFFDLFGKSGGSLPPLPEKFLKGQMAKLAEDLVKEFNPEDFGFSAEDVDACERDPTRAFEILMKVASSNPDLIQKAVQKIGKKLQHKVQTGQFKPQDLAKEAEELIAEFQNIQHF
jgi:hypothetical protein